MTLQRSICTKCLEEKPIQAFYKRQNDKGVDSYCKECRKAIQNLKNKTNRNNKLLSVLKLYEKYPQFDYTQKHSLTVFSLLDRRRWVEGLDYINKNYGTKWEYKDVFLHILRIKQFTYRFFTYKKCKNCLEVKQTYVNSDDSDYVFELLENVEIPIVEACFSRSRATKDGWEVLCKDCELAINMYNKKNKRKVGSKNSV